MNLKYILASALALGAITGVNASQNMDQATTTSHEDSAKKKPEHHKHQRHEQGKHHKGDRHKSKHHKDEHHHGKKHAKQQHRTSSKKVDEAKSVLHVEPANQAKG
jgi:hypothetical protein